MSRRITNLYAEDSLQTTMKVHTLAINEAM